MRTPDAKISDLSGEKFFSQSLIRSGRFLTEVGFFLAVLVGAAILFAVYWSKLQTAMKALLFLIICVYPLYCLLNAIRGHRRIHETYFTGKPDAIAQYPSVNVALDVAAEAILGDLFYTYNTLLVLLFIIALLLHQIK